MKLQGASPKHFAWTRTGGEAVTRCLPCEDYECCQHAMNGSMKSSYLGRVVDVAMWQRRSDDVSFLYGPFAGSENFSNSNPEESIKLDLSRPRRRLYVGPNLSNQHERDVSRGLGSGSTSSWDRDG